MATLATTHMNPSHFQYEAYISKTSSATHQFLPVLAAFSPGAPVVAEQHPQPNVPQVLLAVLGPGRALEGDNSMGFVTAPKSDPKIVYLNNVVVLDQLIFVCVCL